MFNGQHSSLLKALLAMTQLPSLRLSFRLMGDKEDATAVINSLSSLVRLKELRVVFLCSASLQACTAEMQSILQGHLKDALVQVTQLPI